MIRDLEQEEIDYYKMTILVKKGDENKSIVPRIDDPDYEKFYYGVDSYYKDNPAPVKRVYTK